MKKRLMAMFMAMALILTACGGSASKGGDKDSLVIAQASDAESMDPVSYTHLTLPTICSV